MWLRILSLYLMVSLKVAYRLKHEREDDKLHARTGPEGLEEE